MKKLLKIAALSVVAVALIILASCRRDHCPGTAKMASVEVVK